VLAAGAAGWREGGASVGWRAGQLQGASRRTRWTRGAGVLPRGSCGRQLGTAQPGQRREDEAWGFGRRGWFGGERGVASARRGAWADLRGAMRVGWRQPALCLPWTLRVACRGALPRACRGLARACARMLPAAVPAACLLRAAAHCGCAGGRARRSRLESGVRGAWGRVGDLRWGMFRRGRVAHGSARLCVGLLGWLHVRLHAADCMPALAFVQVAAPARAAARPPPVRRSAKLGRSQQVAAAAGAAASRCQPAPRRPQGPGSSHARRDGRRW